MGYEVTIGHENGRRLAVRRFDARPEEMGAKQGQAFGTVAAYLGRIGVPIAGPAVSCYEMGENVFHVSSGFVVDTPVEAGDGVEPLQLPDVDIATTTHVGPYDQLGQAYDALKEGVGDQGRKVDDSAMMWEEYLTGPEVPPEETTTVVHWPLTSVGG